MTKSFVSSVVVSSILFALVGCAETSEEQESEQAESTQQHLTASSGSRISLGGTVTVPLAAVRSAQSQTDLTALAEGSTQPLQLLVTPTNDLRQLVALSGSKSALTLGASVYDTGIWSPSVVVFPAVRAKNDASSKSNIFITIGFKPTELKYLKASGEVAKPSLTPSSSASVTGFDVSLGAAKTSPSLSMGAVTLDLRTPNPSLDLKVSAQEIDAWATWAQGEKRDGTLTYSGPAGSVALELFGVTIAAVRRDDSLQFYTVKCYTEHTKLKVEQVDL